MTGLGREKQAPKPVPVLREQEEKPRFQEGVGEALKAQQGRQACLFLSAGRREKCGMQNTGSKRNIRKQRSGRWEAAIRMNINGWWALGWRAQQHAMGIECTMP